MVAFRDFSNALKNDDNINKFHNSDDSEFNVRKNLNGENI